MPDNKSSGLFKPSSAAAFLITIHTNFRTYSVLTAALLITAIALTDNFSPDSFKGMLGSPQVLSQASYSEWTIILAAIISIFLPYYGCVLLAKLGWIKEFYLQKEHSLKIFWIILLNLCLLGFTLLGWVSYSQNHTKMAEQRYLAKQGFVPCGVSEGTGAEQRRRKDGSAFYVIRQDTLTTYAKSCETLEFFSYYSKKAAKNLHIDVNQTLLLTNKLHQSSNSGQEADKTAYSVCRSKPAEVSEQERQYFEQARPGFDYSGLASYLKISTRCP